MTEKSRAPLAITLLELAIEPVPSTESIALLLIVVTPV